MTLFELKVIKQVIEAKCFHSLTPNIASQDNILSRVGELCLTLKKSPHTPH